MFPPSLKGALILLIMQIIIASLIYGYFTITQKIDHLKEYIINMITESNEKSIDVHNFNDILSHQNSLINQHFKENKDMLYCIMSSTRAIEHKLESNIPEEIMIKEPHAVKTNNIKEPQKNLKDYKLHTDIPIKTKKVSDELDYVFNEDE